MSETLGSGRSWTDLQPDPDSTVKPSIQQRQVIFTDPFKKVYQITADFGEFSKDYYVVKYKERAGMVAVQQDRVLLVRQYRLLIDSLSWEIPGGAVDEDEAPAQAAVRECLEETGIRCFNPQPLLFFHMSVDTLYNPTYIFYSHDIAEIPEPQHIHTQEVSSWEWIPLDQCIEMIFSRQISDSFSVAALLAYRERQTR